MPIPADDAPQEARVDRLRADEVRTEVARIVHAVVDVPEDQVTGEKHFEPDLGVDSLAMIEVTVGVEERFGLRIPDAEVRRFRAVDDLVGYVVARN